MIRRAAIALACLAWAVAAPCAPIATPTATTAPATIAAAPAAAPVDPANDIFAAAAQEADSTVDKLTANDPAVRFEEWQADFVKRGWEWHLLSTKIIFAIVVLVVLFGLVVSWRQFNRDIAMKDGQQGSGEGGGSDYDFTASMNELSMKSKTIGAIILVFSGIFFFLYLSIVYPMTLVDTSTAMMTKAER